MSWRYPKGHTRPQEVVSIDGLNDGFLPVVEECQGRLNEQNFKSGAITAQLTDPLDPLSDEFVPSTFVDTDVWESVRTTGPAFEAPTRGAVLTPGYNGVNNYLSWAAGSFADATIEGWIGAWSVPLAGVWTVVGSTTIDSVTFPGMTQSPMSYQTVLEESTTIWVMCSLQALSIDYSGRGTQFGMFINGALVTESLWGSGDPSNDRAGYRVSDAGGAPVVQGEDAASYFASRGAGTFAPFQGFPVCIESIQEVPPGSLSIEIKTLVRGIPQKNVVGSRELVIMILGR